MKGRPLTEESICKIQKMVNSGMKDADIAFCLGYSNKTIQRVRLGEHVLMLRDKAKVDESKENEKVFIGAILANQREIIQLLEELVSAWSK